MMTDPMARMNGVTSPVATAWETASAPPTGSVKSNQIVAAASVAARMPMAAQKAWCQIFITSAAPVPIFATASP